MDGPMIALPSVRAADFSPAILSFFCDVWLGSIAESGIDFFQRCMVALRLSRKAVILVKAGVPFQ
jgi:hypothetical protein